MRYTAIGYARKSIYVRGTESEIEGVQYQLSRIQEYAEDNDFELLEFFSDVGYSGVLKSRPELNRMLSLLKNREEKVNALILYSQDRLARDLSTSIDLMLEITEYVDEIIFAAENERETGIKFIESFLVKAAQFAEERRYLKQRLRYGREAKVAYSNYYRSTFKPLGYIQKNKQNLILANRSQTTDQGLISEFKAVQYIFLSYLSKMSYREIAKNLNENFGLTKRGKKWDHTAIKSIIQNPVYAGMLSGVFIEEGLSGPVNTIEPLICLPLYRYIQMKVKSEKPGNKSKQSRLSPDIALCLECFKPLKVNKNMYKCEGCNAGISMDLYIELVKKEFQTLLRGDQIQLKHKERLENKKQEMNVKIFRLNEKLQSLRDREEELLLEYRDFKLKQDRLVKLNLDQQKEIQTELRLEVSFYNALFGGHSAISFKNFAQTEPLIAMPYCVLVDFHDAVIYVKYHDSIFEEVTNTDTFSLQMVDKGIRICKDLA